MDERTRVKNDTPEHGDITFSGRRASELPPMRRIEVIKMSSFAKLTSPVHSCLINRIYCLGIVVLMLNIFAVAQAPETPTPEQGSRPVSRSINNLFDYLNMAGTRTASDFRPLTQGERTDTYLKTLWNPIGYLKAGFSAGLDQFNDKPSEWEQGASGYGKRYANIIGQYTIQRTVTFGLSSALHEDNRYFNSGKEGFWPRTGYAMASGVLARSDDGSRHLSVSQIGGVAAGAFVSRLWQPSSQHSLGDGAVSFGISMATNVGFGVVKEFLPDVGRAIANKRKKH